MISTSRSERDDGNLEAALGPVCTKLKLQIQRVAGTTEDALARAKSAQARPHVPRRRRSLGSARTIGPKKKFQVSDISVSGLLIATDCELPVGHLLDLAIDLKNGSSVTVTARVVRVQQPDWGVTAGVGATFTNLDDRDRKIIERYVHEDPTG